MCGAYGMNRWNKGMTRLLVFMFQTNSVHHFHFFSVHVKFEKKTKAVHTASSGNLSCWKMSVRSWLRSFGVCLNTSSRKIEHTHVHKYTWSFCHPGLASVCIRGYAGSPEARIESCLCHDQWQDGWSSRGLLSQPNGVKREGYFNHFQCPFPAKIWRERVFFLMAKPNFDLFQANSMVFWRKHCHHKVWVEHCSISRYKQVIYPKIVACTWPDFYHVSIWEKIGVTKASYIYIISGYQFKFRAPLYWDFSIEHPTKELHMKTKVGPVIFWWGCRGICLCHSLCHILTYIYRSHTFFHALYFHIFI